MRHPLWLKTAAIGFYPVLSGLPRCLAVLLRRRTSVDVIGLFPIYRNRKSSSDFSCRFWNPVLVYTKKEQLHFCNCSFIKNGGYRILSRFIGTPTLLNSVIICWNCFVYTLFDNTHTKKEQLHFCNCSFIKNGSYRILSRFIGTPTLLNSVIICWNCFVYTLIDNTHTKKEQLHFCNCSLIKNGGYRILSRFIGTPTLSCSTPPKADKRWRDWVFSDLSESEELEWFFLPVLKPRPCVYKKRATTFL